jgi:uncharacterized membrane protein YtjA (UPF0391 family)
MLYWTPVFLIVAIFAGVLGFSGISSGAAAVAKVMLVIFLVAFSVSILMPLLQAG